jgi:HPt (histidine-containing phosphotransfer) domain-containing protein
MSEPVFNETLALDICDGDRELVIEMLGELNVQVSQLLAAADLSLQENDMQKFFREVHTIKGSAAALACHPLRDAAEEVCKLVREHKESEIRPALQRLSEEYKRTSEFIDNLIRP